MEKICCGIEGLDKLLYGGLPSGRAYLIAGEPGTGKTIFSFQFLMEGLKNNERCLYITVDEKPEHVIADIQNLGWSISPYLENGLLQILDVTSYFGNPGVNQGAYPLNTQKIIGDVLDIIQKNNISRLVLDPLAPLAFHPAGNPEITDYIRKFIFAVESQSSCTTLMTSYIPVGSTKVSPHGIEEFAASGIMVLRLKKIKNQYIRTLWIRKIRGTRIDLTEYSFEILPNRGFVLRQPV